MKHTYAGPGKSINRKSTKGGYLKKIEQQRERDKIKSEWEKEELKRVFRGLG